MIYYAFFDKLYFFGQPEENMQKNGSNRVLLSLIVPVYNESARIHHLKSIIEYCRKELGEINVEIIISDDGSNDDTIVKAEAIFSQYKNSKIIKSANNKGKGNAIKLGMQNASGIYRIFMDIDLSTPIRHLKPALEKIRDHHVVIGTRKNTEARVVKHQSWIRENMGKGFTALSRFMLQTPVSDFTCGFKIFSAEAAEKIFSSSRIERWAFDSEILFLARKFGYKICEMPVEWKNDDDTRVKMGKVILPTLFDLLRIKFGKYDMLKKQEIAYTGHLNSYANSFLVKYKISNSTSFIFFAVFVILFRLLIFLATQDVGIEHDSAWYLGVAKNFAQNGKYASYTNTAATSKTISASIHDRVTLQDAQGNVYFPAGVTAGPTYVIPQAIFMKIFGFGFWQYRIWPVLGYILLVVTVLLIVRKYGGNIALMFAFLIIWLRPDFFINYAFEAYSEHIALLFALLSLIVANRSYHKHDSRDSLLLSGLFFGIAIMAKNLTFLLVPGVLYLFFQVETHALAKWKIIIRRCFSWFLGAFLPIVLFIAYELAYTSFVTSKGGFAAIVKDFILHWKMGGGGLSIFNPQFAFLKTMVLNNVGNAHIVLFMIFIFILPFYLHKEWKNKEEANFIKSLYIMFLSNYVWFIFVAASGWTRHVWMGLIIFIIILTIIFSRLVKQFANNTPWNLFAVVIGIIIFSIVVHEHANYSLLMTKDTFNYIWQKNLIGATPNSLQGFVFSPVFSWKDLQEVSNFLKKKEYKNMKLYYLQTFLVTEVAAELMRPVFPIVRLLDYRGDGILVIGPYQKGELSLIGDEYKQNVRKAYCPKTIFENPSYIVCKISLEKLSKMR